MGFVLLDKYFENDQIELLELVEKHFKIKITFKVYDDNDKVVIPEILFCQQERNILGELSSNNEKIIVLNNYILLSFKSKEKINEKSKDFKKFIKNLTEKTFLSFSNASLGIYD